MHKAMDMLNRSWEDNSNSTNDDFRGMDDEENEQLGFAPEYDIFPIVLAILIIAANSHALLLIGKVRSLQTATNVMLGSLAISDLLNGSLGIPLYLVCTATQEAAVCSTSQLFVKFISISISSHLLLVSVDRYIAIVHALRYHSLVTKRKVHCLLIATWLTAIFVSVIQLSWFASTKTELTISRVQIIYVSVTMVVFFAAPLVTMIICYITIFRALRSQLKDIARNSIPSYSRKKKQRSCSREKRAAFVFITMIFIYIVCWFPYFLLSIQKESGLFSLPVVIEYLLYYTKFLNSLLNPLLYVYGKHDFRQALCSVRNKKQKSESLSLENTGRNELVL